MAKRKLQMTAFARFFLFLVIFIPALFFGVSYAKGEDGMQTLKNLFGMESTESTTQSDSPKADAEIYQSADLQRLSDELKEKETKINDLYRENERLKREAQDAKSELEEVKQQLQKIKSAIGQ